MSSKSEIILKLYERLRQGPCTIAILTRWKKQNGYTFSDRQFYHYLSELECSLSKGNTGESIETDKGEHNAITWKLVYDKSKKGLSPYDINTFYLIKHFVPNSIIEHRKESFNKMEELFYASFSKSGFQYTADANQLALSNTNFYDITYTAAQHKIIENIIDAIQNKWKIVLLDLEINSGTYLGGFKAGDIIYPLALKLHRGSLQLCGYHENKQKACIISFDTLMKIDTLNETFNPKKYYPKLQAFFETSFGITENIDDKVYDIELEFSSKTGRFVLQFFWHASQQWTALKNGNYLLKLHCGINRELVGWIFQWMSNVKVRKPLALKELVLQKYKDCIDLYDANTELEFNNSFARKGE